MKDKLKINFRNIFLSFMVISSFAIFAFQLVDWQIVKGDYYFEKSNENNAYSLETKPIRGEILDRNGEPFAVNFAGKTLYFDKFIMKENQTNQIIVSLIDLLDNKKEKWIDVLPIQLERNEYVFKGKQEDIDELKSKSRLNMNPKASANECMVKLCEKYKISGYNKKTTRNIASVRYNMTKMGYDDSYTSPYNFAEDVSAETISIVAENSNKFPGVCITTTNIRKDVNGTIAPHIIGITGFLSQEDYEKLKDKGYKLNDKKGNSGVEHAFESELRGKSGRKMLEVKRDGTIMKVLDTQNAEPGHTVYLTIDARLQKVANESLAKNIRATGGECFAGGVTVLDVNDFSVLASSTYPSYDLTKFLSDQNYLNQTMNDKKLPTLDRSLMGAFVPGSIFKPSVACAALQEGTISEGTCFFCNHDYYPYPGDSFHQHCMGTHGSIPVVTATAKSCNIFFGRAGAAVGIDKMNLYCRRLGLGVETGVEIPETSGMLAGPENSEKFGSEWKEANTMQASIGQSDNQFSPIQLAAYAATIANGGKRYQTHFMKEIRNYSRDTVLKTYEPKVVDELGLSSQNIDIVRRGMRQVITNGTATGFSSYKVSIAAKTGTAEVPPHEDNITFICFAPYDNPQIAISVVIQYAGKAGSSAAQNVARDILDAYFSDNNMEGIPAAKLEEVKG